MEAEQSDPGSEDDRTWLTVARDGHKRLCITQQPPAQQLPAVVHSAFGLRQAAQPRPPTPPPVPP
eukprot:5115189-Alexandrium_andersonii.AAC.1